MKKILYLTLMSMCLSGVSAQDNEEINLSGFYLGAGVHNNFDRAKIKYDDTLPARVNKGDKIQTNTDFNYGMHILAGYNYILVNNVLVGIEQQVGVQHHPSKVENHLEDIKANACLTKGFDFITLAKLGYKFNSFPGVVYLSGGVHFLKLDLDDISEKNKKKNICRPIFGIGYQHGLSDHWSMRGDLAYTHVSDVKYYYNERNFKVNGYRISARVTLIYTF